MNLDYRWTIKVLRNLLAKSIFMYSSLFVVEEQEIVLVLSRASAHWAGDGLRIYDMCQTWTCIVYLGIHFDCSKYVGHSFLIFPHSICEINRIGKKDWKRQMEKREEIHEFPDTLFGKLSFEWGECCFIPTQQVSSVSLHTIAWRLLQVWLCFSWLFQLIFM